MTINDIKIIIKRSRARQIKDIDYRYINLYTVLVCVILVDLVIIYIFNVFRSCILKSPTARQINGIDYRYKNI